MAETYDLIIVGSSFSSAFFLKKYIDRFGLDKKILVLERGQRRSHQEMLEKGDWTDATKDPQYVSRSPEIEWMIPPSFGGNSNYWEAETPRFVPSDFETKTRFGVGEDWPISYEDLEPDYTEAERIMSVAGSQDIEKVGFRSEAYPQEPHRLNKPDQLLKAAYPDSFFALPSARASTPTIHRPSCCNSNDCSYCPVDAKFRVANDLGDLYEHPLVELQLNAYVHSLETTGGQVSAVNYRRNGAEFSASADLVVLAANPIFNTEIMLRSGDRNPHLGRGLVTHPHYRVVCLLDGVDNFQGGTYTTGISYELYSDTYRRQYAGCVLITLNKPFLRPEYGRWRQILQVGVLFDDLRQDRNFVDIDPATGKVRITYEAHSDYMLRGKNALDDNVAKVLGALPVEEIAVQDPGTLGCHIMGTHKMGTDPASSVIDPGMLHHQYRNLLLLGGGSFVTPSAVNPTLTLSALALRAGRLL